MSAVSIQRSHVYRGALGLALLSLCFALSASPAFAIDRTLTSYGALCNGSADDTPELRAAFKDAGSRWTNLIFPSSGVCRIVGKITVANKSGFRVTGQNATIKATNGMTVAAGWELLVFSQVSNFQVYDLTVDGNRANRTPRETTAHNIVLADSHNFLFQNVRSKNAVTDGFEVRGRTQAEGSTAHYTADGDFINCQANNSFRIGMNINNGAHIDVRGGSFSDSHGVWPQAGIDIESNEGSASPGSYDILITGAEFMYNNGFGVQMVPKYAPQRITVEKNYFSQNARGGINVGPRYVTIRNNLFELSIRKTGAPCPGTYCFRSVIDIPSGSLGNSMIEGNSIIDAQPYTSGIYAHRTAGSGTTIRNNCLENVKPLAIVNGGNITTLTGNKINPSGGCPIPSGVPLP
jgi:Right handed beta helix region